MESKNRQDLDALRQRVERDRSQQESAFKALEAEYKGGLDRLGAEKARLEEQLRLREQELSEQFRRETAALKSEQAKTAESLTRLTEQRQKEELASEQILSFYDQLRGDLTKPDYEQALRTLASFESFLDQDSIRSLPPIQRRRSVELFVIDSFRTLIERQRSASLQTAPSLLAAAEVLASIQQAVSHADQAYQAGQTEQARALYLAALGKIPELEHAHSLLNRLEREAWLAERGELEQRIAGLQGELAQSNQELALSRQTEQQPRPDVAALKAEIERKQAELEQKERELRLEITGLQQELEKVRSESRRNEAVYAEKRGRLLERLQALRQRYSRIASLSRGGTTVPEQELMALLETKLLLKEVLVSEAVRTRYPDLYENTERFLQVFSEVLQREGQLATLRDLNTILGSLTEDMAGGADTGTLGRYSELEVRDLFYKLLDSLRLMVP
jgi:DNA repair exonuclease SbcCD ATPase subunit